MRFGRRLELIDISTIVSLKITVARITKATPPSPLQLPDPSSSHRIEKLE